MGVELAVNTDAAEGRMSFRRERRPFSQIHVPMDEPGSPGEAYLGAADAVPVPPVFATQSGCRDTKDATWSALSACMS